MYEIIKREGHEYIKVGEFVVGEIYRDNEGTWCGVVKTTNNLTGMKYCTRNRKSAVEGLLKQMIYSCYNAILDDK